jgi:hypothetical protein
MLELLRRALKSVDAFRKSCGGTRRLGASVSMDPDKALAAFKALAERIRRIL